MAASAVSPPSNYDVFLSFRGETRDNFTSHLFAALRRKKINTFIDEAINKGDKISVELLNAKIEGSRISVIIFSKSYASSKWCLDELNKILECKKKNGQIVIPVFYHVHPSDVRHQIGIFQGTFVEHETEHREMPDKVQKWRDSLAEVSRLSGYESTKFRDEADLVDVIVKDVLKKLEEVTVPTDFDGLIGINSRIEEVETLLRLGLSDIRIVGIWGMGGIGKTTLAEAIFKQVSPDFDGKCFMANVREKTKIGGGLEQLQKELLSHLLEENIKKGGPSTPQYTKDRLKKTKVLIVLDDVNKFEQLENLITKLGPFGEGSRIIITTRDKQVLDKHRVNLVYKVQELNCGEAHKLFCNYAFKENHCPEDFMVLFERAIDRAKGNPLALKILGSFLCPKSKREWENALNNLKLISDPDISDVFQMSYKELRTKEQHIFLDIACFFKGDDKDHVISIFDDPCSIRSSLDILVEKSLITISCNKLKMHDLLQEMGQEIVREESEEPENRSRLWDHEDILPVLNEKKGTNSIRGIFLNMSQIKDINLDLDSTAFMNMSHLRFLKLYVPEQYGDMSSKVGLPQGLEYLSDKMRYLHWYGYPWKTLPKNFTAHNLIELSLPYSKLEQLWEGKKKAFKLKFIDLHHSQDFITIPDSSDAPNLERLNLSDCAELSRIPRSIENFNKLGILCLKRCERIKSFPRNIFFRSPITIDLSFCVELTEFPEISGKILELNLSGTAIDEVLPEIGSLTELEKLDLSFCDKLKAVSTSICKLKSLCHLALDYCEMLEGFPDISEKLECLEYIGLKYTAIRKLPPSIENLQGLKTLSLMECSKLNSLPENLGNLKSLKFIHGRRLAISQLPSSITDLKQLEQLSLSGCKGLVLPSLSGLCSLKTLELDDCDIMKIPEDIGDLSSLESLNLKGNNFESLPSSMEKLSKLRELILRNCNNLESLPMLPLHLFRLEATDCERLRYLPKLPLRLQEVDASLLEKLSKQYTCNKAAIDMELDFRNCPKLEDTTVLRERIHHMAFASLRQLCENEVTVPNGVSICLTGSEIPNWFSHQILGSSINIQQPQSYGGEKVIGFALCAVIAIEEGLQTDEDFAIICKYHFNTNTSSKTKHVDRQFVFKTIKNYSSDDYLIILGFDPCSIVGLSDAISFDFFIDSVSKTEKMPKVISCGVHAMHLHLIDTKTNKLTPRKRNLTLAFSSSQYYYDVFLSFSEETRDNFTSHLHAALYRKNINTFMDKAIQGYKISGELLNAKIEGSRISVIIFSKDYTSSKWCLGELNKILECKDMNGQIVIPIFYNVFPSAVGYEVRSFKKAFVEHEKKYMPYEVWQWRAALAKATCLSGYETTEIRLEADLVDVIVEDVLKKLEHLN